MDQDKKPAVPFPEVGEFIDGLAENRLLIKQCGACGQAHFYPRARCPFCGSDRTTWLQASGRGALYSYSIARRTRPFVAPAVIELDEGVRIPSVVVEADLLGLAIGQQVTLHPRRSKADGRIGLAFTTDEAQRARVYAARARAAAPTVAGLAPASAESVARCAIVGAGMMGTSIAAAFANAGIPVDLIEQDQASLQKGVSRLGDIYRQAVRRKRVTQKQADERLAMVRPGLSMAAIAEADVVIEAVYEELAVKRAVFEQIDAIAKPDALLGTNTSALNVNDIAAATRRPDRVVGLHFFSPAHVMELLEVVRGRGSSDKTIARCMALARRIGKLPVLVESCKGFVGNRIFFKREEQSRALLLEGATPEQIDRVLIEFGMPMGSLELMDMAAGVELGYRRRRENGTTEWLGDRMYEAGRLGQKVGKGYYRYKPGSTRPLPDPEMLALLEEGSRAAGIQRRRIPDDEIRARLILPMINEAARVIEEGVVARASDIDAVWLSGYGWPSWRGGILYYADTIGAGSILDRMNALRAVHGDAFAPAPLLVRLAQEGGRFLDLPERSVRAAAFAG